MSDFNGDTSHDHHRISLDPLGVLTIGLVLWAGPTGDWLVGRFQGTITYASFCFSAVVYLIVGIWVLVRIVQAATARQPVSQRLRRAIMPTVVVMAWALPWVILGWNGYALGFASWADANVDVQGIRQWAATVPLDATLDKDWVPWWMDRQAEQRVWLRMPESCWPAEIVRIDPSDVYIMPDRMYVVLEWWRGTWGSFAGITIGQSDSTPPLQTHGTSVAASHPVQPGVWVNAHPPAG